MNTNRNQRGLLIEIMICVLFFALSATALMETFVAAREYSRRAETDAQALMETQLLAEMLYAADDPGALLSENGYAAEENGQYAREADSMRITVLLAEEETVAGILRTATLKAYQGERLVAEIPCARYLPGEVSE